MAARSHPRSRCNKNTHFNFTTDLNPDPKLKEEIGDIMDSLHRMSEKEVEKREKEQ